MKSLNGDLKQNWVLLCSSLPMNLSWTSRKPKLSKEIENRWLGTISGQIWRLQCLPRPLEHPWGRGILLQKMATRGSTNISPGTKTIATTNHWPKVDIEIALVTMDFGLHQHQWPKVGTICAVKMANFQNLVIGNWHYPGSRLFHLLWCKTNTISLPKKTMALNIDFPSLFVISLWQ